MTFKSKVKVTMTFSIKKDNISAMLMVRTLKLSRDVGPHQSMVLRAKVKVTMTFSILEDKTLKIRREVGPH